MPNKVDELSKEDIMIEFNMIMEDLIASNNTWDYMIISRWIKHLVRDAVVMLYDNPKEYRRQRRMYLKLKEKYKDERQESTKESSTSNEPS
jgi:hypothetical protein